MISRRQKMDNKKPLYSQIIDCLKDKISEGEYLSGKRLPTEMELAREFKVSRITSKRVLDELEREGIIYRKKGTGSFLREKPIASNANMIQNAKNINIVALVMPFGSSLGKGIDLIHGASDYLENHGYILSVKNSMLELNTERDYLLNITDTGTSGVILYPVDSRKNVDIVNMLIHNNYPIVTVDRYYEEISIGSVTSDNFAGSYEATSYLIKKGHSHIGYVSDVGLENATTVKNRYLGYCKALSDSNIEIKYGNYVLDYVSELKNDYPGIYEILRMNRPLDKNCIEYFKRILNKLLDRQDRITAIHTVNDYVAIHILTTALHMGVNVPNDLSLIGFDDIEISQHLEVPLTTLQQDFYQIGYQAALMLMNKIEGFGCEPEKLMLPVRLIERESVADNLTALERITA